jgi:hypothetical protein
MTGETLRSNTDYVSLIASEAENDGAFCTISGKISSVITDASEQKYVALDFKLDVTAGTFSAGDTVILYRVPGDSTDQAPTPTSTHKHKYAGTFTLNGSADEYYVRGVPNEDENDKFIWEANVGTSVTAQLYVRARTNAPAA